MSLSYQINQNLHSQKPLWLQTVLQYLHWDTFDDVEYYEGFLKHVYDSLLSLGHDLVIGYQDKQIIGFSFVLPQIHPDHYFHKLIKFTKGLSDYQANPILQPWLAALQTYLNLVHDHQANFDQATYSYVTWTMSLDASDQDFNWYTRNLLNYYCLQDQDNVIIINLNQTVIQRILDYQNTYHELMTTWNEIGLLITSHTCYQCSFDCANFIKQHSSLTDNYYWVNKIYSLNVKEMWTKTFKSPVHPENNIIMIHGVNSWGRTFLKLVPYLLNYGNVIILDLPIHGDSKAQAFRDIEWDINKYALFLSHWIEVNQYDNIYLFGHSMGGSIATLVNLFCYKQVKGIIIEDGYNGYCSILNQNVSTMTKSLLENMKIRKEFVKANKSEQELEQKNSFADFYHIYKPFSKNIWSFFSNLFNLEVLLTIDNAYVLNNKPALALYGVMDGVVNAYEAQKFIAKLPYPWMFEFVPNATHSSHDDNLEFVASRTCQFLASCIQSFAPLLVYDLETIPNSVTIGSPYFKKESPFDKLMNLISKFTNTKGH